MFNIITSCVLIINAFMLFFMCDLTLLFYKYICQLHYISYVAFIDFLSMNATKKVLIFTIILITRSRKIYLSISCVCSTQWLEQHGVLVQKRSEGTRHKVAQGCLARRKNSVFGFQIKHNEFTLRLLIFYSKYFNKLS